jgi:hypothetical protein
LPLNPSVTPSWSLRLAGLLGRETLVSNKVYGPYFGYPVLRYPTNIGCTNHMTGEKKMFSYYKKKNDSKDAITFGDGVKAR